MAAPKLRGVAVDILLHEPAHLAERDVDSAAALGANVIRLSVQWSGIEPLKKREYAEWYVRRLDDVIARAHAQGIQVLLTVVFTPCWASSAVGVPADCDAWGVVPPFATQPPANPQDFADTMQFLAGRYQHALVGVEVWNEPNLDGFWATPDAAGDYAALLRATYPAVKQAAPRVLVVAGALAGSDTSFLDELYEAGIAGFYDVLSVHAYNDGRPPQALIDPRWAQATLLQGLRNLNTALRVHGETRAVWVTELGWNTSSLRGALWNDGVSPDDQAAYLSRAIAMLGDPASGIDFPTAVFVYRLRDLGDDPADPQHNYGLLARDGTAKPSFAAVRDAFAPQPAPESSDRLVLSTSSQMRGSSRRKARPTRRACRKTARRSTTPRSKKLKTSNVSPCRARRR